MAYDIVLVALADPTRRELYRSLRRGDRTVSELATLTEISQPATSQHLRVLRAAELVTERREGTRRYYRASTVGLEQLREYVESLWDDVLAAYAADDPAPRRPLSGRNNKTRKSR